MKKLYALVYSSLIVLAGLTACDDGSLDHDDVFIPDPVEENDEDDGYSSEPTTKSVIKVQLGNEHKHQIIDGFGCSFGWSEAVYACLQREQIMDDLYGEDGLNFNIYRGEVCHTYVSDDGKSWNFGLDRNVNIPANSADMEALYESADCKEWAQVWLIDYLCKKKIDDVYYFFSVWSPPACWKSFAEGDTEGTGAGSFNSEYSDIYARFLTDFVKQYNAHFGINIYGISGWNEPDQAMGGWDGCKWEYTQMADFVHDHLRPELNRQGLESTKVIYDELPWWANAVTWMNNSLNYKPELKDDNIVAAGHAYSTTESNVIPMERAEEAGIPVWLTETCDDKTRDETWRDAMVWAQRYQSFLVKARMNAVVWWAGARNCSSTGENLLQTNQYGLSQTYYRVNRYYTIGQFSKWIQRGMKRVDVNLVSTKDNKIPKECTASAYVNDDTYTIVIVNSSEKDAFDALIEFDEDEKDFQNMISYTSSESVKWLRKKLNPSMSGKRAVTVPKYSVVTITGKFKDKTQSAE